MGGEGLERKEEGSSGKTVSLALQGGGAHGAFTWGVLDRLLQEEMLSFEGISATSAGAMNAVVLAHGLTAGGRREAQAALHRFWRRIAEAAGVWPLQASLWSRLTQDRTADFAFLMMDLLARFASPYEFNPWNYSPLRRVLQETVDFPRLRRKGPVQLFLSATNVRTCKVRVFESHEMSVEAVLASACLPFLFQSVEIDGEHYWDGGYMGNPAIFPLIYGCKSDDVLLVHVNPINRPELPRTALEIMNRINEISFNSSLMREMRAIGFVNRMIEQDKLDGAEMRHIRIHAIEAEEVMQRLGGASKFNVDWGFLTHLRDLGRQRAEAWLATDFDAVGIAPTVDIGTRYL